MSKCSRGFRSFIFQGKIYEKGKWRCWSLPTPVANLIINQSRNVGYFQVRYDSRVVIYDRRGFIRLATGIIGHASSSWSTTLKKCANHSDRLIKIYYSLYVGWELTLQWVYQNRYVFLFKSMILLKRYNCVTQLSLTKKFIDRQL